jgi:homoserine kinase
LPVLILPKAVSVKCHATSANLGSGFDRCGIALEKPFDVLHARISPSGISSVKNAPESRHIVPEVFDKNTCGPVVRKMLADHGIKRGVEIIIEKNIPPASGLGSSAATAAGAARAVNELFSLGLSEQKLVSYAALGETISAGTPHLDNVASAIRGGFNVASGGRSAKVSRFAPPAGLDCLIVLPEIAKGSTKAARRAIPAQPPREDVKYNASRRSLLIKGFRNAHIPSIIAGVDDKIVEPAREGAGFLVGLGKLKEVAEKHGFGACASGAGPALLVMGSGNKRQKELLQREAEKIFAKKGVPVQSWWTKISEKGTRVL